MQIFDFSLEKICVCGKKAVHLQAELRTHVSARTFQGRKTYTVRNIKTIQK
jgi:hypothetical protein